MNTCKKYETCSKIDMIADKDIPRYLFILKVKQVCGSCEDRPVTKTCIYCSGMVCEYEPTCSGCPYFNRLKDTLPEPSDNIQPSYHHNNNILGVK